MYAVTQTLVLRPILSFVHIHDEKTWFRIGFSILAVCASVFLNLGVFALFVFAHMALDIVKYRTKHHLSWHWTAVETVRESLVDMFLIAIGLFFAMTLHGSVAIAGLGRLASLEAFLFAMLIRLLPKVHIAEHILEILLHWKKHSQEQNYPLSPLSKGERRRCLLTLSLLLGIALLPLLSTMSWDTLVGKLMLELIPQFSL